jgi:NADPH2:quinone reductase
MKAIRVHEHGEPEVMRLEAVPDLSAGPRQVLVQIKAAGVNPVDTYIREGWYPLQKPLPYTPGMDGAGTVLQVGREVKHLQAGDRVFVCGAMSGTYAQQALCHAHEVFRLPEGIDYSQGAALGVPYGTACQSLFGRARAAAGQTVLVHGASGGVGIAAVQLAAAAGLTVIATAGTEKGRQLVMDQGAKWALDHHKPEHFDTVNELTEGRGADIVLEMLANVNLDRDLEILSHGGCVVVIGCRGRVEIDPRKAMARDLNILGMVLMNTPPHELMAIYARIQAGLTEGTLCPVVGRELPLEQAARAHHEIIESSHLGKIVLIP